MNVIYPFYDSISNNVKNLNVSVGKYPLSSLYLPVSYNSIARPYITKQILMRLPEAYFELYLEGFIARVIKSSNLKEKRRL